VAVEAGASVWAAAGNGVGIVEVGESDDGETRISDGGGGEAGEQAIRKIKTPVSINLRNFGFMIGF
jgi:hypothetical protein